VAGNSEKTQDSRRKMLRLGLGGALVASLPAAPVRAATPALTAEVEEGPFYLDLNLVRGDLTEGLAGVPLQISLAVLDETGVPLPGARIDVWHCDSRGVYSGYAHQGDDRKVDTRGKTWLRGTQLTGAEGTVAFHTVYPGWYSGRTTHIHCKVIHGDHPLLTTQFFLPDSLSEYLYTELTQYRRDRLRDTLNRTDDVAVEAGPTAIGSIREGKDRYVAALTLVVDRAARSTGRHPSFFGTNGPGNPPPFPTPDAPPDARGARPPSRHVPAGADRLLAIVPGVKREEI